MTALYDFSKSLGLQMGASISLPSFGYEVNWLFSGRQTSAVGPTKVSDMNTLVDSL